MNLPRFALALIATVLASRLPAQSLVDRARAASQRGQLDSAYDLVQRAAEAEPNRAEAQWLLGDIACNKAGRSGGLGAFGLARKCKAAFARAVELAPDSVLYLESLAGFLAQAPGIVGGDRDSALKLAERMRRFDEVRGSFTMAGALWPGNARDKARADSLVEALGRTHMADRAVQLRVAGWWTNTNRAEQALAIYERWVARDARDAAARFFLGRQLVLMKRDLRRAQEHLRFAAAATIPSTGPASVTPGAPWWRLGQSYVQLGMSDSARLCFQAALRINPSLLLAQLSLDSLTHP